LETIFPAGRFTTAKLDLANKLLDCY